MVLLWELWLLEEGAEDTEQWPAWKPGLGAQRLETTGMVT